MVKLQIFQRFISKISKIRVESLKSLKFNHG